MAETTIENFDEENSVTMLDVLQEENQLEEDANAVLGPSDDKNCTYNKGYIRQALYACKTCRGDKEPAAVCLACSFHCHEGHELVELYTKRHFRCDCGNDKFGGKKCTLDNSKAGINNENKYNQNFDGVYCTCSRPYPDPEDTNNDEMLQCIICEDWYHSKHLECPEGTPQDNSFDEVVCAGCMRKHEFLWRYAPKYSVTKNSSKEEKSSTKDEENLDVTTVSTKDCSLPESKNEQTNSGSCFWLEGWRSSLCRCSNCIKMYEDAKVSFLLDPLDSVQAYEEAGKSNPRETQYEKGMRALASLDHVQQIDAIQEYNNMKENLKQYLQKFVENKKVVREEDIKEFFSGMESRKRSKVVVPTFCR
ncbi:putative E3 ubiquitin-protein ligase UBR7 [Venturia canescens]|uniref:putative E3 ubiquitin-protein ligase UBR7 n=1 Tax=Venturia canescens TaxID=32260 RepID=UPI001C9C0E87|nr:putative E3 ubiquitin-protein ligase UBR7 [Venturia canescens]